MSRELAQGQRFPRHVLKKTPSPRDMGGGYEGKILLVHVFTRFVY